MANHYFGKRAAGRKPVGKRALSLLMALVMSLSLVADHGIRSGDHWHHPAERGNWHAGQDHDL